EGGWVYLGHYDPAYASKPWQTQYFVLDGQEKDGDGLPAPEDLAKGTAIHVARAIGEANLRSNRPQNGAKLDQSSVVRHVKVRDLLVIDRVEPVAGTKLYWAYVTLKQR